MKKKSQISEKDFDTIEGYLDGSLDSSEKGEVESRLIQDEVFRNNFEELRGLREGIQLAVLKEKMNVFHEEIQSNSDSGTRFHYLYWGVAASISLLIMVGIWWVNPFMSLEEKNFQTYYNVDPGLISTMSSDGDYEFDRGMVDFKSGEYEAALLRWEKLLNEHPSSDTLNYFIGLSYLELEGFEKSKNYLNQVVKTPDSYFYKDANWYLGLLMVREGKNDQAIIHLKESEREEAEEVISKLQK